MAPSTNSLRASGILPDNRNNSAMLICILALPLFRALSVKLPLPKPCMLIRLSRADVDGGFNPPLGRLNLLAFLASLSVSALDAAAMGESTVENDSNVFASPANSDSKTDVISPNIVRISVTRSTSFGTTAIKVLPLSSEFRDSRASGNGVSRGTSNRSVTACNAFRCWLLVNSFRVAYGRTEYTLCLRSSSCCIRLSGLLFSVKSAMPIICVHP